MPLSDHVKLTISLSTLGVARAGFGVPMILSYTAAWSERLRFYTDISGVAVDFPSVTGPEYLAAQALFGQTPRPPVIAIGRGALKPTQTYVISVAAVRNSSPYAVNVAGDGVTTTAVSITSGGSATNDAIVASLVTALNAVVGANYTAAATGSSGSHVCTVTANAAGDWFSLEVVDVTALGVKQTHADPGVATDLAAIALAQPGWYALLTTYNSKALVQAAAAWVESNARLYAAEVNETDAILTSVGNADTIDALHTSAYARTFGCYHPSPVSMFAAAWLGRVLPLDPGSDDWKWKRLAGPAAVTMTDTHRTNLRARKANTYDQVAGINITWEGTVADGEFIDVIRSRDWVADDMPKAVFEVFVNNEKVPFDNDGIQMIVAAIDGSMRRAERRGIAAPGTRELTYPKSEDVSSVDKFNRVLEGIKWKFELAGSIHEVDMTGNMTA